MLKYRYNEKEKEIKMGYGFEKKESREDELFDEYRSVLDEMGDDSDEDTTEDIQDEMELDEVYE